MSAESDACQTIKTCREANKDNYQDGEDEHGTGKDSSAQGDGMNIPVISEDHTGEWRPCCGNDRMDVKTKAKEEDVSEHKPQRSVSSIQRAREESPQ